MSKKVVFLGCENSHATQFLGYIKEDKKYSDIEILGCHSLLDKPAQEKLVKDFKIKSLESFEECKDNADGVIVTARDGSYHLEFIKPYLRKGVTAFVDKPVTISEEDAIELAKLAKANDVKLTGQSTLINHEIVKEIKKIREEKGCIGGFVRAPISMDNPHGGFYFYSEHLVDMVLSIFGWYPKSVLTKEYKDSIVVSFIYENFQVEGYFTNESYYYAAGLFTKEGSFMKEVPVSGAEACFKNHFDEFYETMKSTENKTDYKQFVQPVFVLNAIYRSMKSGKEEQIRSFEL